MARKRPRWQVKAKRRRKRDATALERRIADAQNLGLASEVRVIRREPE
jgi:hypothetical protein